MVRRESFDWCLSFATHALNEEFDQPKDQAAVVPTGHDEQGRITTFDFFASEAQSKDRLLLRHALRRNREASWMLHKSIRNDEQLLLSVLEPGGKGLGVDVLCSHDLPDAVARAALSRDGTDLQVLSKHNRGRRALVEIALDSTGEAFQWASESLRDDAVLLAKAVETWPRAIVHAGPTAARSAATMRTALHAMSEDPELRLTSAERNSLQLVMCESLQQQDLRGDPAAARTRT